MTSDLVQPLGERVPPGGGADAVLERFLGWVEDQGLSPYPEQEEAILELLADRHVVLSTPTGSGKSLVAMALHFKALCEGRRSFYTAPVKALVSEKFFAWCEAFGAENVGMLTGDASMNHDAPVICCTTEVLANMALRGGAETDAPYVVLDEFHYYADRERGVSWQVPLVVLTDALFLMMSATLGNTARIETRLREATGREVTHVHSEKRPVPLDFEYRETPLHETLAGLIRRDLAPVYVVSFTQRECAELAQGLTGADLASRERRRSIAESIGGFRFDTIFGRDLKRILSHGIGVHHAGMLPKYRLLVEQLAQQGLLVAICGTDTLGVGVNIPIRTVLFTKLSKFDGEKVGLLRVREFKQIAGRAGRKGFDERGAVVCQAPEHVIENKRIAASGRSRRRRPKRRPPPGFIAWNEDTFDRLVRSPPETLESSFDVSHGMIVSVLQREHGGGWEAVIDLVNRSHEGERSKARLRRRAAQLFRSLRRAGIVETTGRPPRVRVDPNLQTDFSLTGALSLYMVEAAAALDPESGSYPLEMLSLVEAVQDDPRAILVEQRWKRRRDLMARLKAQGVDYEERRRRAAEVDYEKPEEEFLHETFRLFAGQHPWVREEAIRPKSIAREMFEGYRSFVDYVKEYSIARSEGLLLRYLSQVHGSLVKSLPVAAKTEEIYDIIAYLRTMIARVDSSLVEAWETLLRPAPAEEPAAAPAFDLALQERALAARVRSELHGFVRALARGEFDEALAFVRSDPGAAWDAARLEQALAPYFEEYGELLFTPEARQAHRTTLTKTGARTWRVAQTLLDPEGDGLWAVHGEIDLRGSRDPEGALVHLLRIGP